MKIKKNGKVINLTEGDLKQIVKKVLNEEQDWAAVEGLTNNNIDTIQAKVRSEDSGNIPIKDMKVRNSNTAEIILPTGNVSAGERIKVSLKIDKFWKITGVAGTGKNTKSNHIAPAGDTETPGGGSDVSDTVSIFTITIPGTEKEWKDKSFYPGIKFVCENAPKGILKVAVVFPPEGTLMGGMVDKPQAND